MSNDLIQQLKACAVKLQSCAEQLQHKIREKKNKNKHYLAIIAEAISCGETHMGKEQSHMGKDNRSKLHHQNILESDMPFVSIISWVQ